MDGDATATRWPMVHSATLGEANESTQCGCR